MSEQPEDQESTVVIKRKRPLRNLTELSLKWLADRVRKAETIRERIQSGEYKVDASKIATKIANEEEEKE